MKNYVDRRGGLVRLLALVVLYVSVLGCSSRGCGGATKGSMSMRSFKELQGFVEAQLPQGGVAASLPIPVLEHGSVRAAIFVYACSHEPDVYWQQAPERLLVLNAETAEMIRDTPAHPGELGPAVPDDRALPGSPERKVASMDELLASRERLSELAPSVWSAFGEGRTALPQQARADVAEYVRLMEMIEPEALMPYYHHIGKGFYDWTSHVQVGAPR